MDAKEYLSQAYRIDQRINSKLEQVMSLRALLGKATGTLSGAPKAATPNLHSMEIPSVKWSTWKTKSTTTLIRWSI